MNTIQLILIALSSGIILSFLSSYILEAVIRRRLSQRERTVAEALSALDKIFKDAKGKNIDPKTQARLRSEAMRYFMNTQSKKSAEAYLGATGKILGSGADSFIGVSKKLLDERLNKPQIGISRENKTPHTTCPSS